MIDIKDLRIGNFIKDKEGNQLCVYGVAREDSHNIIWYDEEGGFYLNDDEAEPIPLTPEILEGCGFERISNFFYDKWVDNLKLRVSLTKDLMTFSYDDTDLPSYKYLHQLQNIYHSLTGQELQINLTQKAST
jgi:hypothetical protein